MSRAEADINQKPKDDPAAFDMFPGSIESAVVVEPVGGPGGGFRFGGGWSIVDDERKKPHEAVFLPLEPLDTNDASVLRVSLHHTGGRKFKSLIGRFRISYTEDDRVRELLLPAQTKLWSSIGPFPAEDTAKAYTTAFEPEKDIKHEPLDLKKNYTKVVLANEGKGPGGMGGPKGGIRQVGRKAAPDNGAAAPRPKGDGAGRDPPKVEEKVFKPIPLATDGDKEDTLAKKKADKEDAKADGSEATAGRRSPRRPRRSPGPSSASGATAPPATVQGSGTFAYYLTRKIVSTSPRTATVQIDGPVGFKMWLNGELVQSSAPPPPVARPVRHRRRRPQSRR